MISKILILGLGVTGKATFNALQSLGTEVAVYDQDIQDKREWLDSTQKPYRILSEEDFLKPLDIELCIKSPGMKMDHPMVMRCKEHNISVLSDLEMAYRLYPQRKVIAITGTNGKTTTTTLVGEIFKNAGYHTHVVGNIGVGLLESFVNGSDDDVYVIECSSFQLESTDSFRPNTAAILNVTPDHVDWHGNLAFYIQAKLKIFSNLGKDDVLVYNLDDTILKKIQSEEHPFKQIRTSQIETENVDLFVEDQSIYWQNLSEKLEIISLDEIPILGKHNVENVLIAAGIAVANGIDVSHIRDTIRHFKGVEHRIEYVRSVQGVDYYNDSKGTNVDATLKAIESMKGPFVLIAGGYDKKADLLPIMEPLRDNIIDLILLGETKHMMGELAKANGIPYTIVDNMEEAVKHAHEITSKGDTVLLSPACASWDMYTGYEKRGAHFKEIVRGL